MWYKYFKIIINLNCKIALVITTLEQSCWYYFKFFKQTEPLTDHGFQFDSAHDEVVKRDAAILAGVAMRQDVEDVVVDVVTGRVQGLSQLKCAQETLRLFAVDAVYRLKHNKSTVEQGFYWIIFIRHGKFNF